MIILIVGVSSRLEQDKYYLNKTYLDFLTKLGLEIKLLFLDSKLSDCDSFFITGGYDINPKLYDEVNTSSKNIDDRNDEIDYKIIKYAVDNKKPLLGICRGIQVINTFFKGTLHQDILKNKKYFSHVKKVNYHLVELINFDYVKLPRFFYTHTYHHQAINKLGNDLIVLAKAKDETIEAICHKTLPIIAFQWHVEISSDVITKEILSYLKKICFY